MGKGKRFELETKKALNANTKSYVKAHRPDFSGSSVGEAADLMVVWQAERYEDQRPSGHPERHVAYTELKKRTTTEGNRTTVMSLKELQNLRKKLPTWSKRAIGVKFPQREMIALDAEALEHWLRRDEDGWGHNHYSGNPEDLRPCERHGARLTPSNNISMVMPKKGSWRTQRSGLEPWKALALMVGLEEYDFV